MTSKPRSNQVADFAAARTAVDSHLREQFAGEPETPATLPYGWDTGAAWAPQIAWDGVMGVYIYLVDKKTGELKPLGFGEFLDLPDASLRRVGPWPKNGTT